MFLNGLQIKNGKNTKIFDQCKYAFIAKRSIVTRNNRKRFKTKIQKHFRFMIYISVYFFAGFTA